MAVKLGVIRTNTKNEEPMKKMLFVIVCTMLLSCDNEANTRNVERAYSMPEGLTDCAIFRMESGGVMTNRLYVVRCPNSYTSTTFPVGKSQGTVAVVELDTAGLGEYLLLKKKFDK
jgi:hypothetical protein